MQRLQKERDSFQEEMEKMHERIELQQNQIGKMQREKENMLSELDLVKERWEKMHNTHQKLTVRIINFLVLVLITLSYLLSLFIYSVLKKIYIYICTLHNKACFALWTNVGIICKRKKVTVKEKNKTSFFCLGNCDETDGTR